MHTVITYYSFRFVVSWYINYYLLIYYDTIHSLLVSPFFIVEKKIIMSILYKKIKSIFTNARYQHIFFSVTRSK